MGCMLMHFTSLTQTLTLTLILHCHNSLEGSHHNLSERHTANPLARALEVHTSVVFIALCGAGQQLGHGGTHRLGGAAQVLGTLL